MTDAANAKKAVVAMYVGLALTVLAGLTAIIGSDSLAQQLHAIEDAWIGHDKASESQSIVLTYLLTLSALGIVSWLWLVWAVKRGKRWVRPVATTVFVLGSGVAVMNLVMEEYGQTILPTLLGMTGVLPCVAGLAAVALLWRSRRGSAVWTSGRPSAGP
ncbi:hypothetical protein [Actinosynnema sp. ALI-1.44]|uniref:hypothetical protein n=1 Tax=Actinosynnema sp. ALI-1.44 TaxID=1933779 RepID=UPI00192D0DEB|nr:hypothetical protein [Actinosynnema sp. ALI-1.44]